MDKCIICGKEFIRIGHQKTCSPECRKKWQTKYMQKWWDKHYGNRTIACVICGKEFESRYGRITCSTECQEKRSKQIDSSWYTKNYHLKIKTCVICGKKFSGRGRSKVCSDECLEKYKKQKSKEEWEAYSQAKYGEIITRYLIDKLKKLNKKFVYKNEQYTIYKNNYSSDIYEIYWKSTSSKKMLKLSYVSDQQGGVKKIKSVTFWDDYEKDSILEELTY